MHYSYQYRCNYGYYNPDHHYCHNHYNHHYHHHYHCHCINARKILDIYVAVSGPFN